MLESGLIACLARGMWEWGDMKSRHKTSQDLEDGRLSLFFSSSIQGKTGEPGLSGAEGARGPPVSAGPMLSPGKCAGFLSYRNPVSQHSGVTNSAFSAGQSTFITQIVSHPTLINIFSLLHYFSLYPNFHVLYF